MQFLQNLCSCFSPTLRKSVLDYLSSSQLNHQVIQEQKCTQQEQSPEDSIYKQVKSRSYYFMKVSQDDQTETDHKVESSKGQFSYHQVWEYPQFQQTVTFKQSINRVYKQKLTVLQQLFQSYPLSNHSKVYDSQCDLHLQIYSLAQLTPLSKRYNSFYFQFQLNQPHGGLQKYLTMAYEGVNGNRLQSLLQSRQIMQKTDKDIQIVHRKYGKVLVVGQHQFFTAQKTEKITQQDHDAVYTTVFSIKKHPYAFSENHSLGFVHLAGLKVQQPQKSSKLMFSGYLNVELEISVNANMLRQPIAKEVRGWVSKLVASLTGNDSI